MGGYLAELLNADLKVNEALLNIFDVKNTARQMDRVYEA